MMAKDHLYSAIANQKLAFARLALGAAAAQDCETISGRLARHAHLDAAILQLCSGLTYFIAEVAEQYSLKPDPGLKSPIDLLDEFSRSSRQSAAIAELQALRKRPASWFAELLATASDPLALVQRFKPQDEELASEATPSGMIPLLNLSDGVESGGSAEQGPIELVTGWARAAQEMIDRQRTSLHEE
jgi:hypothetical protein